MKQTTLTAWFELNQGDERARELRYPDIPEQYTYSAGKWRRRKRGMGNSEQPPMIGRMYSATPADINRYYLRLLLTEARGPTSYKDLLTGEQQLKLTQMFPQCIETFK